MGDKIEVGDTVRESGAELRMTVERTRHGIVQERATVFEEGADVPVALVLQRSTYGRELDSAVGFARINDPDWTHDAASFMTARPGVRSAPRSTRRSVTRSAAASA